MKFIITLPFLVICDKKNSSLVSFVCIFEFEATVTIELRGHVSIYEYNESENQVFKKG